MVTQHVHRSPEGVLLQLLDVGISTALDSGLSVLTLNDLASMVPPRSPEAIRLLAGRAVAVGLVVRAARGLYILPSNRESPLELLTTMVLRLRPRDFSYVSLESCALGYGATSSSPYALTVMTSGRSARIETIFGTMDLVHTKRPREILEPQTRVVDGLSLPVAARPLLEEDLALTGRSVVWPSKEIDNA